MKFSLKELLFSVALASLGMAALSKITSPPLTIYQTIYQTVLVFAAGPLLGLAIGGLLRRPELGIILGIGLVLLYLLWLANGN